MDVVLEMLAAGEEIDDALADHAAPTQPAPSERDRATIDHCFSAESVAAILARLDSRGTTARSSQSKPPGTMRTKCPTSHDDRL